MKALATHNIEMMFFLSCNQKVLHSSLHYIHKFISEFLQLNALAAHHFQMMFSVFCNEDHVMKFTFKTSPALIKALSY